jgi:hypothetical protein
LRATLLGLVLCGVAVAADITAWKQRQALPVAQPGVVAVTLPLETLDAARPDYSDLRVIDPAAQEVAFVLQTGTRPATRAIAAKSVRTTLTDTSTQLLIDCGGPAEDVSLLTPAPEFVKRARIETSPDGIAWRTAEEGVPLFRQSGAERLTLRVNAPFVRLTLDDARTAPVPFTGASVTPQPETAQTARPLGVRIARREEFAGETVLTLELAAAHVPLDTLTFATPERLFTRRVTINARELRDETATERTLASGTIYTIALDAGTQTSGLSVPLGFTAPSRELIVHIANNDSPPLAISSVEASRFDVTLYFDAATAGEFALLTGNAQVAAPRYDVSRVRVGKNSSATRATPGPLLSNPAYRPAEVLAGATLLAAPLDTAPWSYRKAVQFATPGVHQMELDLDVLVHAQPNFGDLRLMHEGAQVPYLLERPTLSRTVELTLAPANDPQRPRIGRWEIKLPRAGLPLTQLTLTSPTTLFQRQLRILEKITDDRGNAYDRALASVAWSRTPGDTRPLVVPLSATASTATLLLETDNGDNPPLVLASATAAHPVARLLFKTPAAPLTLYYGNRQASAPRYDLALVAGQILAAEKSLATLAPEEKARADGWAASALGGARGGIVFWGVLALVVVVLLVVVARLLPKPPAPPA